MEIGEVLEKKMLKRNSYEYQYPSQDMCAPKGQPAPSPGLSARGFTQSATRCELNCYDYAVLPTQKAEEPTFLDQHLKNNKNNLKERNSAVAQW